MQEIGLTDDDEKAAWTQQAPAWATLAVADAIRQLRKDVEFHHS